MKLKSKISSILVLFILLSPVFFPLVSADGTLLVYDYDMELWGLQDEDQQYCFINYENGFENMLLSVVVSDFHGEKAVWIFPVPAKPDETVIDIIKGSPRPHSYDVKERADETISDVFYYMRLTQLYTISTFFPCLF
ncbi:MAG: hypothetical protein SVM80_09300 [Halobacteriota archaeon]|nr:hypothetical protein [Halobacteriota archaeon]